MKIIKIIWRVIISIILIAIAIPILLGVVKKYVGNNTQPPTVAEAPYIIRTPSRLYYGAYFMMDNGTPELKNYWTLDGANYHFHRGIIAFTQSSFGKFGYDVVLIQRMTQGQ